MIINSANTRHPVRRGACCLLAAALLTCSTSQAQTTISLEQALSAARAHNIAAQQSGLQLQAAGLARRQILAGGLPQVHFSAGGSLAPATRRFGYDPAESNMGQLRSQLIVEQPLYDGGRRRAKAERVELEIAALTNDQAVATVDRDMEVRQAFVAGLRAQAETDLRDDAVSDLSNYRQLVRNLRAGGTATSTDLLRTQVELATAQVAATQARQTLAESKLTLAELMGTPSDTAFVLTGSLADSLLLGVELGAWPPLLDTTGSLDLSAAQIAYRQSLSDVHEAERERWPGISLFTDMGYLNSRGNLVAPSAERYSGAGYSIGVSFDLPVFDWGSNHLQVQQRKLTAESVRLQMGLLQRHRETQFYAAVMKMVSLGVQLDTIRAAIATAEDNFVLTKARYAAGGALASEVLSARQLVTETKLSELGALAERQSLRADLERLMAHPR